MKILAKVKEELDDLREQYAIVMSMDDPESLALVEEELGIKLSKILRTAENCSSAPPHKRFDLGYALVFAGLSSRGTGT